MFVKKTNLNYIQDIDFKADRELIMEVVDEKRTIADVTATLLARYTADAWSKEAGEFSTRGAKLIYFGDNKRAFPTKPVFDEVLIIELSHENTVEFAGKKLYMMLGRQ